MRKFFNIVLLLVGMLMVVSCAKDLGLTGGQGSAADPDFLNKEAYELDRKNRLEQDMNVMWLTERVAGKEYSTIPARAAIRRVFADTNLHFKGTLDEFLIYMSGTPSEKTDTRVTYKIEAPTYTDYYDVIFGSDKNFQRVEYRRTPRLRKNTDLIQ